MSTLSLRLSDSLAFRLSEEARRVGKSRAELARDALAEYVERRERERFMSELVAEMKAAYADPEIRREALEMAEAFLPLDNEALDLAEGRKPGESWQEETDGKWWR